MRRALRIDVSRPEGLPDLDACLVERALGPVGAGSGTDHNWGGVGDRAHRGRL